MKQKILIVILLLAAALRFWQLSSNPPSLYWDEVSQGYNSYSILKTGFDEHKEFLPIARFQAFGDYKAPVYIYLDVPFIALFGLNELGVRFPSALFGTLMVLLTYFLVKELLFERKEKETIALISSFSLAISPWHIQLSRVAYEANIATFFTILGIYLFFLAKRRFSKLFILSSLSFVVAFYAFNSHRIFIPLLIIALWILYWKELLKQKTVVFLSGILGVLLLIPFILYLQTPESKLRFTEVNIFSDSKIVEQSNYYTNLEGNTPFAKLVNNRRILYSLSYVQHYLDFFDPNFLFIHGDVNPRFSTQNTGELYLWEVIPILVGIYILLRSNTKSTWFILAWFLLAPVAAATARETPHALRAETYMPLYEVFVGVGMYELYNLKLWSKLRSGKKLFIVVAMFFIVSSLYIFAHDYFTHYPISSEAEWQYGYKQTIEYTEGIKTQYDYIVMTSVYGRPYVNVLFYGKYNPVDFWAKGVVTRDNFGFYTVSRFDKYIFRNQFILPEDKKYKVLYVGAPNEIPNTLRVLTTIPFKNNQPAFVIANNQ